MIAPIMSSSCNGLLPPITRVSTNRQRSAQRVAPPLLNPPGKRDLANIFGGFSSPYLSCPNGGIHIEITSVWRILHPLYLSE
ncbi:hypothetical protein AVEN_95143-1 [Araneus ventricosus]|uniref:Uncharacterized protein n=1 Tax=Araneus ventricosus TaxID=182803 RepID=A0A4Y2MVB7_ARAVE|nr:hypothetical protein AVEN_95143-1 [Araneus ventricosus]